MAYSLWGIEALDEWLGTPEGRRPDLRSRVIGWIHDELLQRPNDVAVTTVPGYSAPAVFAWVPGPSLVAVTYYVREHGPLGPTVVLLRVGGPAGA